MEQTGGEVEMMDPSILVDNNFSNILSKSTIATNVKMVIKLHRAFQFRNQAEDLLSHEQSTLTRDLGSVTSSTEVTFEYRLKKLKEILEMRDVDLSKVSTIPFQVQIEYTALDGTRYRLVITKMLSISSDKKELELHKNLVILQVNAIQTTALLARKGQI